MPHDKNGVELKVGDIVNVACRIKEIHLTEDFCNVSLEVVERMPPQRTVSILTLNSKQTIKA